MDKSRLALIKVEELEELFHKSFKKTENEDPTPNPPEPGEGDFFDRSELQEVKFNNKTASNSFSIITDGFDFGFGANTFFISGYLTSTVATDYIIKVYINGYFNNKVEISTTTLTHYCQFLITTCNYSKETFVLLEITPTVTSGNTITASNFVLGAKSASNIVPSFKTPTDLGRGDNKIKFTVMDGVDLDGVEQKKYGFAVLEDGVLYGGECQKENFAYENCNYIREITTYKDKGLDFATSYYVKASPHVYWYHVLYYSDINISTNACYKNLSLDGSVSTMYRAHDNWQFTPAIDSTKKSFLKTLSISASEITFGYTTTTNVLNVSGFYKKTTPFYNFQSGAIPIARNLSQTLYAIPCFLLKENNLYFYLEDTVTEPVLVSNIADKIEKITHAVFDGAEDKILLYYRSNGFLKCYHISRMSDGHYYGDYFENMFYGITEYFPLIDNDAVFVYGDKIFFTKEAEKLWLSI